MSNEQNVRILSNDDTVDKQYPDLYWICFEVLQTVDTLLSHLVTRAIRFEMLSQWQGSESAHAIGTKKVAPHP